MGSSGGCTNTKKPSFICILVMISASVFITDRFFLTPVLAHIFTTPIWITLFFTLSS